MKQSIYINFVFVLTVLALLVSIMAVHTVAVDLPDTVDDTTSGIVVDEIAVEQGISADDFVQVKLAVSQKAASGNDYELPFIPIGCNHVWNKGVVTTPATCTESGVMTFTCKKDSSHTYTQEIQPIGHRDSQEVVENIISATCVSDGSYDEVIYCSRCGEEISRETVIVTIDEDAHDWGDWEQTTAPTETEPGEEIRICKHDPNHTETRAIPALGPSQVDLSFLDDEIIIVVPNGAIPDESEFDVQKIVPPPEEVVEKVNDQFGSSSTVFAYYEVRLYTNDGSSIIHLDGEITIKMKMPEQYIGNGYVRILQEDETGKLIVIDSWWEDEYICYKTDWLEIYD